MRLLGWQSGSHSHRLLWSPGWARIIPKIGWITSNRHGLNVQGVRMLPEAVDLRTFAAIVNRTTRTFDDPVAHFARLGLPFPKALLGYRAAQGQTLDSRTRLLPVSLRPADIPETLMDANAAHLCPLDYLTHSLLPALTAPG